MSHHQPNILAILWQCKIMVKITLTILLMSHHQQQYLGNTLATQNHGKNYTYNTITVSPSTTISWQSFGSAKRRGPDSCSSGRGLLTEHWLRTLHARHKSRSQHLSVESLLTQKLRRTPMPPNSVNCWSPASAMTIVNVWFKCLHSNLLII